MSENDSRDDRDDGEDESAREAEPSEEQASSAAEDRPRKKSRAEKLRGKARREEQARAAKKSAITLAVVSGVAALAAGGAAGWFGHIAQAKAKIRAESAPAASGSAAAGPCGAWQDKICSNSGKESAACNQAKGATGLLTPGTCEVALEAMPATLAKVKAERVPCDNLVGKLCKDVSPDSCTMVKERIPSFPRERCEEMLKNYEQVLGEVKMLEQRGGMQGSPHGHGADDGHGH